MSVLKIRNVLGEWEEVLMLKGDKGETGNGIENTILNSDYTLTITFTDGTSYTTPSIRGEKGLKGDVGNGIASTVLNNDYTLTINFTDGTQYTTPPIRGKQGEKGEQGDPATSMEIHICSSSEYDSETRIPTIQNSNDKTFYLVPTEDGTSPDLFTEWVYVNGAWEMFGSAKIDLSGYVKNTDYATLNQGGVVKVGGLGITITDGEIKIQPASSSQIKRGSGDTAPINASKEHEATFYGLAKASGDTTQSQSSNPVGTYTDEAKASIKNMLGVEDVDIDSKAPVITETISGDIVSFDDGADMPLQSLVVDINPVQDLHGQDAPYPAGGGKNLLDESTIELGSYNDSGGTIQNGSAVYRRFAINLPSGTYTFSCDLEGIYIIRFLIDNILQERTTTFTLTKESEVKICFRNTSSTEITSSFHTMIELGSTATAYAPYSNICPISGWTGMTVHRADGENPHVVDDTYAIDWQSEAGTVYGGTIDVVSGVLTITYLLQDLGALEWRKNATYGNMYATLTGIKRTPNWVTVPSFIMCSQYATDTANNVAQAVNDKRISVSPTADMVLIYDSIYTDASTFTAAMSGVQLVYELAEPIVYHLTPTEVKSLLGTNHVWADTGDVKVEYRADTELFIRKNTVEDVQINGTSIVENGVAKIPRAGNNIFGVGKINPKLGIDISNNGEFRTTSVSASNVKDGTNSYLTIPLSRQHESTFYGLAKAAGADEKNSTLPVGQYTDNAKDSIQNMLGITPLIASHETDPFESNHVVGELFIINGKLYRAKTALTAGEYVNEGTNVEVVSVAGVLDDTYVKNTDYATSSTAGVVKTDSDWGVGMYDPAWSGGAYGNFLYISPASSAQIKSGSTSYKAVVPNTQHESVFYGLAKAAGDTTQASSSNAVGTYTDEAKSAIKQMLSIADNYDSFIVNVEGTDPTITGQPSYRYNCGEVLSLTVTPPETGTIDFRFTSGSSPTVLTLPSTVKMPEWWVEVEANTIYEMCITDGVYCGVMSWAM